jgi:hypothetical protein
MEVNTESPTQVTTLTNLLFIHHQQPEVLELDVLPQQGVRADRHVNKALRHALQPQLLLPVARKPAEHRDLDLRKLPKPLHNDVIVLLGQDRRGGEDGDL